MFGTLRYDRESQHSEFIDRTDSFLGDAATEHAACDKCRLTKLRCTGQRSGCDRCRVRGAPCVYSATGSRESRARKRAGSQTTTSSLKEKKQQQQQQRRREKRDLLKSSSEVKPSPSSKKRACSTTAEPDQETTLDQASENHQKDKTDSPSLREESCLHEDPQAPISGYRVLDLLSTWPHTTSHLDLDLELPPSPDAIIPELSLDADFLTSTFMDMDTTATTVPGSVAVGGFGITTPSCYPDFAPDGGLDDSPFDAPFFTSSPASSDSPLPHSSSSSDYTASTSPMFTHPPCSPVLTANADMSMPFNTNLNSATGSQCSCLRGIVTMLEDLDELVLSPNTQASATAATIDDSLASLKTQISNAARVLNCTLCAYARSSHIALLTRACEMLVQLAERIVLSYQAQQSQSQQQAMSVNVVMDSPPPTPAPSPPQFFNSTTTLDAMNGVVNPATINLDNGFNGVSSITGTNPGIGTFFGRYKTDPTEWDCLMRVLIGLQLKALGGLLASIRQSGTQMGATSMSSAQISRLHTAESFIQSLLGQLESSPSPASPPSSSALTSMPDLLGVAEKQEDMSENRADRDTTSEQHSDANWNAKDPNVLHGNGNNGNGTVSLVDMLLAQKRLNASAGGKSGGTGGSRQRGDGWES